MNAVALLSGNIDYVSCVPNHNSTTSMECSSSTRYSYEIVCRKMCKRPCIAVDQDTEKKWCCKKRSKTSKLINIVSACIGGVILIVMLIYIAIS